MKNLFDEFYDLVTGDEDPEWNTILDPSSVKHSRRIQQKRNHIAKQKGIIEVYGEKVVHPHRYHKTKSMNCGNPNCVSCGNPRKFWGERTIQERRFYEDDEFV